ncbi:hypothetical protein C4J96_0295 [Pseudomonas orientalis]|nr:hypothetical protein C4J96_0295 [Pseudomonas orientalis]
MPPMAVGQSACLQLIHRHRGQAPSHILIYILSVQYGSAGSMGLATTGNKQPRQHHHQAQNARRDDFDPTGFQEQLTRRRTLAWIESPQFQADYVAASQALTNSAD